MEAYHGLRRFVNGFNWKYLRKQVLPPSIQTGLPDEVPPELINKICLDHFDERARSFTHMHLSGWKRSGAYRLFIKTQRGKEITLIYKDALYAPDQIPALTNLPVRPGPPEYAIYSRPVGKLAAYLPQVYMADELVPGIHYRYYLEDLSQNYHRPFRHLDDIITTSSLLSELHQALGEWVSETNSTRMLIYGPAIAQALQEYFHMNLERYSQHAENPTLKTILDCWTKIEELHLLPEFNSSLSLQLIHGDTNYTNIYIHRHDQTKVKIVDWEWAGYGQPYADFASFLKSVPKNIETSVLEKIIDHRWQTGLIPAKTKDEHLRMYYWCQLERGLLDAAFLAVQQMDTSYPADFELAEAINQSLLRVISAYHRLLDQ